MITPRLGDRFPKEYRESFCKQHLKIGAVLRLHVSQTTPPKIKRFVVLGINEDDVSVALLFINRLGFTDKPFKFVAYISNYQSAKIQRVLSSE
jgi:hypothetical protein